MTAATTGWRPYALLLLLCTALYVPGLSSLPVTDRDEARFAQATRQMLETGDFLDIRFGDTARNNKPAGIYWLQAAAVAATEGPEGRVIWPYRLPSLLGAIGAVLLTFAFGSRLVGSEAALLGAALLASSLALSVEAHLAKTDAVLLCLCVAAQGALASLHRASRHGGPTGRWALLFWAAQALAILVKGPVAPVLSILTAGTLAIAVRDWRWLKALRPLRGALLLIVIVGPWLVAINIATHGAFLHQSVGHDFLGKIAGIEEGHGALPGYYLVLVWLTFWPGSLLLVAAGAYAWRERGDPSVRFLAAWAVPFWIVLEIVVTKLPHYLLPVFPALALLAGAAAHAADRLPRRAWQAGAVLWGLASLAVAVILIAAPIQVEGGFGYAGLVAALVILLYGVPILRRAWRAPDTGLGLRALLLAVVAIPLALAVEAPRLTPLWLSRSAAYLVARTAPDAAVAAAGYAEPSLVFLLGTKTLLATPAEAAERLAKPGWVALVESRDEAAFEAALRKDKTKAEVLGRAAGLDYSNGKRMVLTLYRKVPITGLR